ncbi:MAG: alpha/beta hydrolase fold domain-containing protein [Pararhodobacter sp.]
MRDYGFLPADVRAFIADSEAALPPDATQFSIAEQRALYDRMCQLFDAPIPPGVACTDRSIAGVACREYTPARAQSSVTVVYFHGGGFVVGGLESHHAICADLSAATALRLIAVDYRLSPEHLHPAAYDDAKAVAMAVAAEGPVVLAGDSAGGALAAAVAAHVPGIRGQVLIYPGLGGDRNLPSYQRHPNAPMLSRDDVLFYAGIRFAPGDTGSFGDPTAMPLAATEFGHLPPTAIFTAACDPLASDGVEYAARLAAAGVPVDLTEEPGLVHGYLRARHRAESARGSFARIAAALAAMARASQTG